MGILLVIKDIPIIILYKLLVWLFKLPIQSSSTESLMSLAARIVQRKADTSLFGQDHRL
jgi:hypothetical protein